MSFTIVEQCTARLNRSELAVPGSNPKFLEKAATSPADVIFLDLEDAVAPDDKVQARKNIIEALNDLDWGGRTLSIRINGLDTHYMYRDVVDIIEQAGQHLDLIMIPKAGTAADIYALDMLVTQIEDNMKLEKRIGFEMIIETALGMANVDEIAGASKRNESLHFGVADYAAAKGGIIAFTKNAANEFEKYNIQVNCISPVAQTRMTDELLAYRQQQSNAPAGSLTRGGSAEPQAITPAFVFFACGDSDLITGQVLALHK